MQCPEVLFLPPRVLGAPPERVGILHLDVMDTSEPQPFCVKWGEYKTRLDTTTGLPMMEEPTQTAKAAHGRVVFYVVSLRAINRHITQQRRRAPQSPGHRPTARCVPDTRAARGCRCRHMPICRPCRDYSGLFRPRGSPAPWLCRSAMHSYSQVAPSSVSSIQAAAEILWH